MDNAKNKQNKPVNQRNNFIRGSVELMILYLLSQYDSCYGYQLTQLIDELTGGIIQIPIGSLYPALYRLIDAGYISDEKKLVGKRMERVYYHIEDTGRARLKILMDDYSATTSAIQSVLSFSQTGDNSTSDKSKKSQ